jgi:phenylacetate-coenzyme A ligase PaaK-like adenylate-forming protein
MDRKNITKDNRYFLKELETLSVDALKSLQFEKTKQTLKRTYHSSDFYRQRFDEAKVKPEDFKHLEDIARFPFIDKQDLIQDQEKNPPFGSRVCVEPPSRSPMTQPHVILRPLGWKKGIYPACFIP